SLPVTLNYATSDGTATSGSDYYATNGALTFGPGELTKTITVPVVERTIDEPDKTFYVNLSNPTNGTLGKGKGAGTIVNDVSPRTISINDVQASEGNSGTTPFVFTVSLSAPSGRPISVDFKTADGTAIAPVDYQPVQGTLQFAPQVDPGGIKPASVA